MVLLITTAIQAGKYLKNLPQNLPKIYQFFSSNVTPEMVRKQINVEAEDTNSYARRRSSIPEVIRIRTTSGGGGDAEATLESERQTTEVIRHGCAATASNKAALPTSGGSGADSQNIPCEAVEVVRYQQRPLEIAADVRIASTSANNTEGAATSSMKQPPVHQVRALEDFYVDMTS